MNYCQEILDGVYWVNALHVPVCLHQCAMHMQHQMTTTVSYIGSGVSPDKDAINQAYRYAILISRRQVVHPSTT